MILAQGGTPTAAGIIADYPKIVTVFCTLAGTCCGTNNCNSDPVTTKSGTSQIKLNLILVLILIICTVFF